jgi:hypothetical protein
MMEQSADEHDVTVPKIVVASGPSGVWTRIPCLHQHVDPALCIRDPKLSQEILVHGFTLILFLFTG